MATAPAPRQLRKDAARNRDLLLEAAAEVFAEHGLGATLDDIAHRAGVGVGTAYRHFANKQVLADALLVARLEEMIALAHTSAETIADPWTAFETFFWRGAQLQSQDRGLREVLAADHGPTGIAHARERLGPSIERLIRAAQAAGQMRPDLDITDIALIFWMVGAVIDRTGAVKPTVWRRYVALLLDGIRAQAGSVHALAPAALTPDELDVAMLSWRRRRSAT